MHGVLRWFFRGFILLFVLMELVAIAAALFAPDIFMGGSSPSETRLGLLVGGVITLVITVAQWPREGSLDALAKQGSARLEREAEVQKSGLPARAVIVSRASEKVDGGELNADLTLDIHVAGRASYQVTYFWYEPEDRAAERMRVGRELEARVDPNDPSFVVVHWGKGHWYTTRRA